MKYYDSGLEVYEIGHKYYNDSNNCTVVTTAIAAGVTYGKAFNLLKSLGRKTGKGVPFALIDKHVFKELGFRLIMQGDTSTRWGTVSSITTKLPSKGTFIAYVSGHVLTVRDGKVMDWTEGRRHRIKKVYQVVKDN
jgi:hypothetical protein